MGYVKLQGCKHLVYFCSHAMLARPGSYSDTWRLGPRTCRVVDPLCTQCADAIKETCYRGPQTRRTYLDPRVQPVPGG